jgi:hypothetical protein
VPGQSSSSGSSAPPPLCKHTASDFAGLQWVHRSKAKRSIPIDNKVAAEQFTKITQCMDSTLFRDDKNGWDESCKHLFKHIDDFEYVFMNTQGRYRGFEITCKHCQRLRVLTWSNKSTKEYDKANRMKWLAFFGQKLLPGSASIPMV